MAETISERIVNMPRVSSTNAATSTARDLVEALKHPRLDAPFSTINGTYPTALINLAGLFYVTPKVAEQQ